MIPDDPSISQLKVYGDLPELHVRLSQVSAVETIGIHVHSILGALTARRQESSLRVLLPAFLPVAAYFVAPSSAYADYFNVTAFGSARVI